MFQGSFKGVSRKFQGCFTKVSMTCQDKFKGSFEGVLRNFQGCLKNRQGYFKVVSKKSKECFEEFLCFKEE